MAKVIKTFEQWKQQLTPQQFEVTRRAATERPFTGEHNDRWVAGTYQCVCCGQDLFVSDTKFDAGCGWPSFTAPAGDATVRTQVDRSHFMVRTEVLCAACDGHLGHVFPDGPRPTGLRYCINSASLTLDRDGAGKGDEG